jgi:hypothetical protein
MRLPLLQREASERATWRFTTFASVVIGGSPLFAYHRMPAHISGL